MSFRSGDELAGVAVIGGDDETTRRIVERLLAGADIDCVIEGSAVYGVQVRRRDLARADEILRSSSELTGHWIQFAGEQQRLTHGPDHE